eukprot:6487322-Amphidinium_carterae.1
MYVCGQLWLVHCEGLKWHEQQVKGLLSVEFCRKLLLKQTHQYSDRDLLSLVQAHSDHMLKTCQAASRACSKVQRVHDVLQEDM